MRGRKLFEDAIAGASEKDKGEFERRYALWLTAEGEEDGIERLMSLAEKNPGSALAQIDLLNSNAAWIESDSSGARDRAIARSWRRELGRVASVPGAGAADLRSV